MQTKGTAIRALLAAIEQVYGAQGLRSVKQALTEEHRAAVDGVVLPTTYYPIELAAAVHDAIKKLFGNGTTSANRRIGAEAARNDFRGVYKVFVRFMEFENVLKRGDSAFKQYNSQGEMTWSTLTATHAAGAVTGVRGWTEPMWVSLMGRFETILTLCGGRAATAKVVRFSDKDCVFELAWVK